MSGTRSSILACFVLSVMIIPLRAQDITVIKERDLNFGMVFTGTNQTLIINLEDPGTAFFEITGPRNAEVYISFILPTNLLNNNGNGSIPLFFDDTSAGWHRFAHQTPPGNQQFDPAIGIDARIHPGGGGQIGSMFVWLGGFLTIEAQQPAGAYSGTATIIIERTDI